jgi:hypothetical protein
MTRWLPLLVGLVATLVAIAVLLGVDTHLFPGGDALTGVLGSLAIGYGAKTLGALGLARPAPPAEASDDE